MISSVVDLSHHNDVASFWDALESGIHGVIHKASQGFVFSDAVYKTRRQLATDAGLMWGAYHFGSAGDGIKQADHFLDAASPTEGMLLALDIESNGANSMTLDQARAFIHRVNEKTGRWPGIYSNSFIDNLLGPAADPTFAKCWLWKAQYNVGPPMVHPTWPTWSLWQYTDGTHGPNPDAVPDIGPCDRDQFNGDLLDLTDFWTSGGDSRPSVIDAGASAASFE